MCVLCDYTSPDLKNFNRKHLQERLDRMTKLHAKSLLDILPGFEKEYRGMTDSIILPEKKRQADELLNHLVLVRRLIEEKTYKVDV